MKVQNFNSGYRNVQNKTAHPNFGNYIIDRQILRALEKQVTGGQSLLLRLGKNNGENLNNIVTAVGTAGVAPIFIRYNPISKEDPKVKAYSAARQPLSAVLALGVQLPVMTAYNRILDEWAASGAVKRFDLSAKPPESVIKSYAQNSYKTQLALAKMEGKTEAEFLGGKTKAEFIEDIMNDHRNNLFYTKRDQLRTEAQQQGTINGKPIKDIPKIDFVKPSELDEARKSVYADVLEKEFGITKEEQKALREVLDDNKLGGFKDAKVKKALKEKGFGIKEFKTKLEAAAQEKAINSMEREIAEEVIVKKQTSQALNEMQQELAKIRASVHSNSTISLDEKIKQVEDAELKIIEKQINKFKEKLEGADDVTKRTVSRAIEKISGKKLAEIKFHGLTEKDVETSVRVKRWLRAEINRREGVFANAKKLSGLVFGLAILPFTCGLLNWAYPRFMERFFPGLCDAKKASANAKEAK